METKLHEAEARAHIAENMIAAAAVLNEAGIPADSPQAPRLFREMVALPDERAMRSLLREAGVDERALKLRDSAGAPSAYTPAARKLLAKEGKARPDGSYPIRTAKDVENAVADFNRAEGSPEDKAHIIEQAKAVDGGTDALPGDWSGSTSAELQESAKRLERLGIPTLDGAGGQVRLREATAADLASLAERGIPVLGDSPLGPAAPALDGIPMLADAPGTRRVSLTESECGKVVRRIAG